MDMTMNFRVRRNGRGAILTVFLLAATGPLAADNMPQSAKQAVAQARQASAAARRSGINTSHVDQAINQAEAYLNNMNRYKTPSFSVYKSNNTYSGAPYYGNSPLPSPSLPNTAILKHARQISTVGPENHMPGFPTASPKASADAANTIIGFEPASPGTPVSLQGPSSFPVVSTGSLFEKNRYEIEQLKKQQTSQELERQKLLDDYIASSPKLAAMSDREAARAEAARRLANMARNNENNTAAMMNNLEEMRTDELQTRKDGEEVAGRLLDTGDAAKLVSKGKSFDPILGTGAAVAEKLDDAYKLYKLPANIDKSKNIWNDSLMTTSEKIEKQAVIIEELNPSFFPAGSIAFKIANAGKVGGYLGVNAYQNANLAQVKQQYSDVMQNNRTPTAQAAQQYRILTSNIDRRQKEIEALQQQLQKLKTESADTRANIYGMVK